MRACLPAVSAGRGGREGRLQCEKSGFGIMEYFLPVTVKESLSSQPAGVPYIVQGGRQASKHHPLPSFHCELCLAAAAVVGVLVIISSSFPCSTICHVYPEISTTCRQERLHSHPRIMLSSPFTLDEEDTITGDSVIEPLPKVL